MEQIGQASWVFQAAGPIVIDLPEGEGGHLSDVPRRTRIKKGPKLPNNVVPLVGQALLGAGALQGEIFRLGVGVALAEAFVTGQKRQKQYEKESKATGL